MHRSHALAALALALAVAGPVTGCGASPPKKQSGVQTSVSAADQACRDKWAALGSGINAKAAQGVLVRQAFQTRWDSIGAGIGYYQATARADQCGDLLTAQRKAINDLDAVVAKALPYDIASRVGVATAARAQLHARHPSKKEPKPVRAAYRTLRAKVTPAANAVAPAFTELAAADPAKTKAVRRGLKDLALLSKNSAAYVACRKALATIKSG